MRENRDFVVPVNILTTFAHAPFSWAARHTTVCLDSNNHIHIQFPLCPIFLPVFVTVLWLPMYVSSGPTLHS